jgi:hypothetical protein
MIKKITYLLPALALLFSGCVKEGLVECYSGLLLRYYYTMNPEQVDAFGSDVNELTVHVFDSEGVFYEELVFDVPGDNSLIHLPLPDGQWSVVTWGSESTGALTGSYDMGILANGSSGPVYTNGGIVKGQTNLEEARLWIKNTTASADGRQNVANPLRRLYHASLYDVVSTTSETPIGEIGVPLMQSTNTLRVVIRGLDESLTRAVGENSTVIADMENGHYRHNNELCTSSLPLRYRNGQWAQPQGDPQHDVTILRPFVSDTTSTLTVTIPELEEYGYEDGLISLPIIPTILENPDYNTQQDLDEANLYIFEYRFDDEMDLSLTVNGWEVVDVDTIVGGM